MCAEKASRIHSSRRIRRKPLHLPSEPCLSQGSRVLQEAREDAPPLFFEVFEPCSGRKESYPPAPGEMSLPEKDLLCLILTAEPPLPFPLHPLKMASGPETQEYEIPQERRQQILRQLYPFLPIPSLDTRFFDLHQQTSFVAREFRVIRERDRNILVSPYYPQTGGTVLDWIPRDDS